MMIVHGGYKDEEYSRLFRFANPKRMICPRIRVSVSSDAPQSYMHRRGKAMMAADSGADTSEPSFRYSSLLYIYALMVYKDDT